MVEIGPSLSAMPFVKVLGIDVHYVERGASVDEAKRTAVLLHGFPLDLRSSVASFEPAFAGRPRWRRLYLDFPGMGQTRAPAWVASTDDVFRVTKAAVEALAPARYALGGSSFGGYIAAGLAAATLDSVLGMALVVPMVLPHGNRELAPRRVLVREDGLIGSEIAEETAVIVTAETLRRTREEIEDAITIADDDAVARIEARYGGSFPIVPPSGTFDRPTLVIAGRQDSVLGFNDQWRIFGQWPRVTYAVLDRGGHGLYIELQPLHDALMNDWINRVEAESIG
jgi:pimeloyl-ACP methyl ester carboxylesterase